MPVTPTYDNLAGYAWPLIHKLMANASNAATSFLGPAGTAIIERHFTPGWLNNIKIGAFIGGVPAPVLSDLWTAMGYSDAPSFKRECDKINPKLFAVLSAFTNGAGFTGITYNTTIYVESTRADDLSLAVHELVHSLQWFHFAKTGFLSRYIEGFVKAASYDRNPAEIRAYGEQNNFAREADIELARVGLGTLARWGAAIRTATDAKGAGSANADLPKAIAALMKMTPLGITAATAPSGM